MNGENELDSTCGVSDDELTKRFVEAIRIDNEIKKIKGVPIQKYDHEKKQPYLEYPNGRREYVYNPHKTSLFHHLHNMVYLG